MCCLSTTKIVDITYFLLESYKNTRTKKKDHPLGGCLFLHCTRNRARTQLNAARTSAAGDGWTEPTLD